MIAYLLCTGLNHASSSVKRPEIASKRSQGNRLVYLLHDCTWAAEDQTAFIDTHFWSKVRVIEPETTLEFVGSQGTSPASGEDAAEAEILPPTS